MRLSIESTDNVVDVGGVQCRVWKGQRVNQQCLVFVHRIAVDDRSPLCGELERELRDMTEQTDPQLRSLPETILKEWFNGPLRAALQDREMILRAGAMLKVSRERGDDAEEMLRRAICYFIANVLGFDFGEAGP